MNQETHGRMSSRAYPFEEEKELEHEEKGSQFQVGGE